MTDPIVDPPQGPTGHQGTTGLFAATASMVAFKALTMGSVAVVAVLVARQLEPRGRGVFILLVTVASIALLVSSLGVNVSGRVHLVMAGNSVSSGDYLGLSVALAIVQALLCVILGLTLLPTVDVYLSSAGFGLFALLGVALLTQYLLNDALNAYGFTTAAAKVECVGNFLQLAIVLLLVASGQRSVMLFITALVVGNLIQAVMAITVLRWGGISVLPTITWSAWRRLLRAGLPGIPTILGQVLTFRLDRYLVGLFMNPAAVGIYSVAATASELLRLPSLALSQPMLYRLAAGRARIADFARVRRLCLLVTVVGAAGLFAIAPFIVHVFFGAQYSDAVVPMRLLLLGEAGIAVFYLDGAALAGSNRIKDAAVAAMTGLVIVVLLDLALIRPFGLAGAAWASVVCYSLMGLIAAGLLRRVAAKQSVTPMTDASEDRS